MKRSVHNQDWLEQMRSDWNARAVQDARYYVCTDIPSSDDTFFGSGRDDYERLVRPFLARFHLSPKDKTVLEIGCGLGRMTTCFAQDFRRVIALDISEEMIRQAGGRRLPRTEFVLGNGRDLAGVPDGAVDFVFSYLVFQHIPQKEIVLSYLADLGRVLRPGGLFRVHMNGLPHARVFGLILEGYISRSPRLQKLGIKQLPMVRRHRLGTWIGHPIGLRDVRNTCGPLGLRVLDVAGRWTEHMWVAGQLDADAKRRA